MRILFLEAFTPQRKGILSAGAKARWGTTCGEVLKNYLIQAGHQVISISQLVTHPLKGSLAQREMAYIIRCYQKLLELKLDRYDIIFIFHIRQHFPGVIKKILFSSGKRNLPIVGYTHGSHWDPSDAFRFIYFPGFQIVDLACLDSLDRILVVSEHMKQTLFKNISKLNPKLAEEIHKKIKVVGLPINPDLIDSFKTKRKFPRLTIIFNHTFISSKNPVMFLRVMKRILKKYDINLIITREIPQKDPATKLIKELKKDYPGQIFLGNTLPLNKYCRFLWMSDIQVSTATHESLGIATLEAMYTKNCCLLPNQCCYPELVGDCKSILYSYTEKELFKKLSWFIEHKTERQRIGEILHKRSLNYTPAKVGMKVLRALGEVVRTKQGSIN